MIVLIGEDRSSFDDTYFPSIDDPQEALLWLKKFPSRAWLILAESTPIGLIMVHSPVSPGIPAGYLETGTFIVREHRGRGFATKAWGIAESELRGSVPGLAGVPWETNHASISRLKKSGFTFTKRVWYESPTPADSSGWCEVWTKVLH